MMDSYTYEFVRLDSQSNIRVDHQVHVAIDLKEIMFAVGETVAILHHFLFDHPLFRVLSVHLGVRILQGHHLDCVWEEE